MFKLTVPILMLTPFVVAKTVFLMVAPRNIEKPFSMKLGFSWHLVLSVPHFIMPFLTRFWTLNIADFDKVQLLTYIDNDIVCAAGV